MPFFLKNWDIAQPCHNQSQPTYIHSFTLTHTLLSGNTTHPIFVLYYQKIFLIQSITLTHTLSGNPSHPLFYSDTFPPVRKSFTSTVLLSGNPSHPLFYTDTYPTIKKSTSKHLPWYIPLLSIWKKSALSIISLKLYTLISSAHSLSFKHVSFFQIHKWPKYFSI